MAKKSSSSGGSELNLDSLMDAVTNVVGVLMIVFVVMALNTARVVQKILSDLPPVTEEEHKQMKDKVEALPPPVADPKKLDEEKIKIDTDLKKIVEDLKTIDTSDLAAKAKSMDLDEYKKQLEARKKEREQQKAASEKLLAEVERLKALLDQTPIYQPPPAKYVRLPNPRPYPEKPNETRVLVAKQGVLSFNQPKFMQPILDGMEKVKSQLEYQRVEYPVFAKLMEKILGPVATKAWPEIAPLVNRMQIEHAAETYKVLAEGGIPPTKQILEAIADLSIPTRSTMPVVAAAIVSASKGSTADWVKLDPSRDPATPIIKATTSGGKITFGWGAKTAEVKANPKDVLEYFVKDLAKTKGIEDASKARTIYDATRIAALLQRAATNPLLTGSYTFEVDPQPTLAYTRLALKPKGGGGETVDALKLPNSAFIRLMRDVKADPNGVVLFQVMPDAFDAYLEARRVADEVGVAATWDFLAKLDINVNLTAYEIQRLEPAGTARPRPGGTAPIGIAPPKKTLD
ncbi:MAG: hypothetical protein IPK22_09220 [Verrucomicrobiaceae bacterium]|nr:hypothetical protein [Verrucomicrobiaceae bacterium]